MDTYNLETIGGRIGWAIDRAFGSQSEFARSTGKKQSQVNRWIKQADRGISEETIGLVAAKTGVPPSWLRYGGPEPITESVSRGTDRLLVRETPGLYGAERTEVLIRALNEAAEANLSKEELEETLRWAAKMLRARLSVERALASKAARLGHTETQEDQTGATGSGA